MRFLLLACILLAPASGPLAPSIVQAHGLMTVPASRAVGTPDEDYQFCFGADECACGDFPEAGPIMATWQSGQTIEVTIDVTLTHEPGPVFRFQLCPPDVQSAACFEAGEFASTPFDLATGLHTYELTLPDGFVCDPCVLRWKWDYGFLSCADVRIVAAGTPVERPTWSALKAVWR